MSPVPDSASAEAALIVRDLTRTYPTAAGEVPALRGIDVSFRRGQPTAIMGPSGCGKTSLLNIMAGMDRATSGSVQVGGQDLVRADERALEQHRLARVGYVFQFFNLIPSLSALANVELPLLVANTGSAAARRARAEELLERVGLAGKGHKRPEQLSGGEQQRVALCVALANDPPIILGDEPTGNLDSRNAGMVIDLLTSFTDRTVVIATHDPNVADRFSRLIAMQDGRIVSDRAGPAEGEQ